MQINPYLFLLSLTFALSSPFSTIAQTLNKNLLKEKNIKSIKIYPSDFLDGNQPESIILLNDKFNILYKIYYTEKCDTLSNCKSDSSSSLSYTYDETDRVITNKFIANTFISISEYSYPDRLTCIEHIKREGSEKKETILKHIYSSGYLKSKTSYSKKTFENGKLKSKEIFRFKKNSVIVTYYSYHGIFRRKDNNARWIYNEKDVLLKSFTYSVYKKHQNGLLKTWGKIDYINNSDNLIIKEMIKTYNSDGLKSNYEIRYEYEK